MMPGPTLIKKCSKCQKLIEEETMMSGNTCGAVFWTDGEYYADMLPDQPELVKCPHCKALLWLEDLEVAVGEEMNYHKGSGSVWIEGLDLTMARPYKMPNMNDYFRLLKMKISNDERETYLRLRAWRAGNDKRRRSEHGPRKFRKNGKPLGPLSYTEIKNMKELICILDEQDGEKRLLKAELFRELGCFSQCLNCLAKPLDEEYKASAACIKELAEKQDPWVREIKTEGDREGDVDRPSTGLTS